MSALATAAVVTDVATRAKPFDLRRQETIERARLRALQPMLETVCHRIGGTLTAALRQAVRAELVSLDQASWEDYAASLPEQTFMSSAVLLPLDGRVTLHLPVPLMFLAIDYYLGGDGLNQPDRSQLTDMERNLVSGLMEGVWNEVPQPFGTFVSLNPEMIATASSASLLQVGRPGVLCVVVRMNIQIGDHEPVAAELCLPATVVTALIEHLERHQNHDSMSGVNHREARRRLLSVPVEMRVAYPALGLRPAELLALSVGDVIHVGSFDLSRPHELQLTIGDVPFGTGLLVETGKKLMCTIVSKKERSDDDD